MSRVTELETRAYTAYFRSGGTDQPAADMSGEKKYRGLHYVVLRNVRGILAVYRYRNNGTLRRLVRWPKGLE